MGFPNKNVFLLHENYPNFKLSAFSTYVISLGIIFIFVVDWFYQLISYVFLDDVGFPIKKVFAVTWAVLSPTIQFVARNASEEF